MLGLHVICVWFTATAHSTPVNAPFAYVDDWAESVIGFKVFGNTVESTKTSPPFKVNVRWPFRGV